MTAVEGSEKEMNDWINVDDDMPQIKRGWNRVTVTVIAKLKSGEEVKAFATDDDWYYDSTCHKIYTPVVAWKSEPTP
jgi:hypothetical protein